MYFVKYGKEYLHDPRNKDRILLDLTIDGEENSCGYCDFTIYPTHPLYDKLQERDSANPIEVYDNEVLLFAGFIYELGKEFYLDGNVKCKGILDYLSDSVVRPYTTKASRHIKTVSTDAGLYFEWLINQHNNQVVSNERFVIGVNQGSVLKNKNIAEMSSNTYPKTIDEIREKLLGNFGGFLVTRVENGVRYIDYLSEWTDTNSQVMNFGVNLTDYTQTDDASETATFIVPLGAKMSETEYEYDDGYFLTLDTEVDLSKTYYTKNDDRYSQCKNLLAFESGQIYYEYDSANDQSDLPLTIQGTPNGGYGETGYLKKDDVVYCKTAVEKYGWIGFTESYSDIKTKEALIKAGTVSLKERISPKRTIEIKAVDMHLINPNLKPIRIGEYVRIVSPPHNLDSYFLCVNISLDLNNPENSIYTMGTTFDTLTGQQNKKINELNAAVNRQYAAATETSNEARNAEIIAELMADKAVVKVAEEYAVSASPTTVPTSDWTTTVPEYTSDVFMWRRTVTEYGSGTTDTGTPVLLTGNSGSDGEDAVLLRIESSRGTVFKNDDITTVLSAVIYKGSERITNISQLHTAFGTGAYLQWSWQKLDDSSFGVISASDSMIGDDGFTLTISAENVDTKVTFMCQLIT